MTSPVICETQVAVRYAETDAMRIVHHSNYIIWFELGRVEYMKQIGSDYAAIEHSGHFFAVTEVGARYLSPARFGDTVKIRTWLDEVRSRTLVLRYEVRLEDTGYRLHSSRLHRWRRTGYGYSGRCTGLAGWRDESRPGRVAK